MLANKLNTNENDINNNNENKVIVTDFDRPLSSNKNRILKNKINIIGLPEELDHPIAQQVLILSPNQINFNKNAKSRNHSNYSPSKRVTFSKTEAQDSKDSSLMDITSIE